MSSQELQFSSQQNREKFAFEGCLIALDKFSTDNTKNLSGGVIEMIDRHHDGCKVRMHTDA